MAREFIHYEMDINKTHLIGHSLGAHMAGYIAKEIQSSGNGTMYRITGLDPAGPGFDFPESWYEKYDNLTETHLWHTDATFVDVIHTGTTHV